ARCLERHTGRVGAVAPVRFTRARGGAAYAVERHVEQSAPLRAGLRLCVMLAQWSRQRHESQPTASGLPAWRWAKGPLHSVCTVFLIRHGRGVTCFPPWPALGSAPSPPSCGGTRRRRCRPTASTTPPPSAMTRAVCTR